MNVQSLPKKRNSLYDRLKAHQELFFLVLFAVWFSLDYFYSLNLGKYVIGRNTYYLRFLSPLKYAAILYVALFRFLPSALRGLGVSGSVRSSGMKENAPEQRSVSCKNRSFRDLAVLLAETAVLAFLFLTGRRSGFYELFYAFLLIIAAKDVRFEKVVKLTAVLLAVYLPLTYLASRFGILDEVEGEELVRNGIIRRGFGFQHPNHIAFRYMILHCCLCYLFQDESYRSGKSVLLYLFTAFVLYLAWTYQNSRCTIICIVIMTAIFLFRGVFAKLDARAGKALLMLLVFGALVIVAFSVAGTLRYEGTGFLAAADRILSCRLSYGKNAVNEFGLSVFGRVIALTKSERAAAGLGEEIIIDCAYVNILLRAGIAALVVFAAACLAGMWKHASRVHYFETCILFLMVCAGAIELDMYQVTSNIFLLLIGNTAERHGHI